jgi:predicted MPP superfamily phosphohydrolase
MTEQTVSPPIREPQPEQHAPPRSEVHTAPAPRRSLRSTVRSWVLTNLWSTLGGLLGLMQALAVHWWFVVLLGEEGLGAMNGIALGVGLCVANVASLPVLRRARMEGGRGRLAARLYMATGIITLLVGIAIALSFVGLFPLAQLGGWMGLGAEGAFLSFRVGSVLLVFSVVGMALWAFTGGQKRVERTRMSVPIAGLHEDHRGLQIGHLTDLHIGNGLEGARLSKMVEQTNALGADLLVLTGDIFDFDPSFVEDGARRLGALEAPRGVYAVLGNHDTYAGAEIVAAAFAEHAPGIRLLRDEWVRLPLEEPLYLAGVEDPGRGWTMRELELDAMDELSSSLPDDGPALLLVHRPQAFAQAARLGFPLVLTGHTHGGQLALPTPGGQYNLALVMTGFARGLYQSAGTVMYVNRGIGVAGPAVRFNCRREMAMIELA